MAVAAPLQQFRLANFGGGLNLSAAPSELAQNETPDCMNVTLDERGGVVKRLGFAKIADFSVETTSPQILYYSPAINKLLMQVGTKLYASGDGGTNFGSSLKTFSTSARIGICDFISKAVIIHPADGAFTYDGTTFSAKVTNSPNGNMITAWNNALWSGGDPANPTRLTRGDLGAITWPASNLVFNDVRAKDDTPLTALITAGAGGLVAFKEESCYRVQDSSTGSYMMLSPSHGASGPLCVTTNEGLVAAISRKGIIVTDGLVTPRVVSEKLEPLFRQDQLAFSTSANWTAGPQRDHFVFSFARAGATENNMILEFNPSFGWFVPHGFGVQSFASYTATTRKLFGAKLAATGKTSSFECFKGGTDDGVAITSRFQTPWFEPGAGVLSRFRRLRVKGRGTFTVSARADYADAGSDFSFLGATGLSLWNGTTWGGGLWNANPYELYQDFYSLGVAKAISFVFSQSSSTSQQSPKLLVDGASAEVGDFAAYGLDLDFIRLGSA